MLAGCGLDVAVAGPVQGHADRQGQKLSLLVNDSGTISCDGGKPKPLPDPLLLQARDLATNLNNDAKAKLELPGTPPAACIPTR